MRKSFCGKCAFFGAFKFQTRKVIMVCAAEARFVGSPIREAVDVEGIRDPMAMNRNNDCLRMRKWSAHGARILSFIEVSDALERIPVGQIDRKVDMDAEKRRRDEVTGVEEWGQIKAQAPEEDIEESGGGDADGGEGAVSYTDGDKQLSLDLG